MSEILFFPEARKYFGRQPPVRLKEDKFLPFPFVTSVPRLAQYSKVGPP